MEQNDLIMHQKSTSEVIQKEDLQQQQQQSSQQQSQQPMQQKQQPSELKQQQQSQRMQQKQQSQQQEQQQSQQQQVQLQQKRPIDSKKEEQRKTVLETHQSSILGYNTGKDEQENIMDHKQEMKGNENGVMGPRERLKRHRREVAGHVWIPDMWGQEDFLKDWIDCTAFDASLVPQNTIMLARASLMEEGRRSNSHTLRVENSR